LAAAFTLALPSVTTAEETTQGAPPGATDSSAPQPNVEPGPPRQPSFVENAGLLNRNEHALLFFVDAELLPAAVMAGYRYGIFSWWDIGVDVGGNLGVLEALIHTKMLNFKTKKTEFFFWGFTFKTGYKYHKIDFSEDFIIDDKSWIYVFENSFSFRFGRDRRRSVFVTTKFYLDQDLHTPRRQNDFYLGPAHLGFETIIGKYTNFFVEAGVMWAINGMETADEVLYKGDWFPVMQMGFAARTGDRTARYKK
jgi:hypothetical protein